MSDPTDPTLINIGTHTGVGALAAALTTAVSRFFTGREAAEAAKASQEVSTRLAVIEEQLKTLTSGLGKHAELGERVALLEQSTKALHERLDGKRGRR